MTKSPQISVIVPIYNVERYIRQCIDSILVQTFTDFELLLIDDGSPDGCPAICDEYAQKDARIRVIHKPNGGISSARNRGIDEACGKWLIFLDSDDTWADPNCLQKLYSYTKKLNLDLVRFEYQAVNEQLEYIEPRSYNKSNIECRVIDNYELIYYGISGEWFPWLYLLRKEAICGLRFNEQTSFQEDTEFFCRLLAAHELRCGYIDDRMYLYRKRTDSITNTAQISNLKGMLLLCDVFYNESAKIDNERLKRLYIYYSVKMYCRTLNTMSTDEYFPMRKEMGAKLCLSSLQKKALMRKRRNAVAVPRKYLPGLYFSPSVSIWLTNKWYKLILKMKQKGIMA